MRTAAVVVALLLLSCSSITRYKPKGELVPYQGFHAKLPSGMQVVVYEVPQVDRFSLTVSYGSGSTEDPEGKEGLAHLVEHLAFRCTPAGSGGVPIWDQLTAEGWRFNASTDLDSTDYYAIGKPADLGDALRMEAARMRDPLAGVTEDVFAIERDVVLSEYRERFETDRQGAQIQWLLESAFRDHPFGRPVGGTPESLRATALSDARAWVKDRYVPANAVAVIVSPQPSREVVRQLVEVFGELAVPSGPDKAPITRPSLPLPPRPSEVAPLVVKKAPVRAPIVWVGWAVPGLAARRDPQGEAAAAALEKAFGGVLFRHYGPSALLKVDGWGAFYWTVGDQGLVILAVRVLDGSDGERVAELARSAALELILDDDPGLPASQDPLTEHDRKLTVVETRDQLLVDAYLEIETLDGGPVARFLRATGSPDYLAGRRKNISTMLNSDISSFAAENMKRERSVAVLVLPDANGLASGMLGGGAPSTARDHDDLEDGTWVPPGPDRVRAVARPPGFAAVARRSLPNGLTVYLAQRGRLPVAEVKLLLRTSITGTATLPSGTGDYALATNTARFAQVQAHRVGASARVDVGPETILRSTWGSSSNLDVLLESTAEWARDQRVRYFSEMTDVFVQGVRRMERDPDVLANRELLAGAFPDHPYSAFPRAETLKQIGSGLLSDFLRNEFRPERATLIVVSNQPESPELWAAVERHFGGWARGDAERVEAPEPSPPSRRITLVDRPGASQAVIGVALRMPALPERDRAATDAVAWLLENRLMQRLRIEEGVTYGTRVHLLDPAHAGALIVSMAVDRKATASSLSALLAAPGKLAAGVTPAEAGRARWQVARRYATAFDTVAEAMAALVEGAEHGLPPEAYDGEAESIATLDAARIKAAAARISVGKESIVVEGDASVVGPQLAAGGFTARVVKP